MRDLAGKVAVITGAGSGIGRAVALELASVGMHIVVSDLDPGGAHLVADEVEARGVRRVNLLGVVNGIQAFLPRMRAQDGEKHIVCTASMSGIVAFPTLGAYTATKYAVVGICETLRQEVAKNDIGVSVLCPGPVATNIGVNSDKQRPNAFADAMLVRGDRTPEEAAAAMSYMQPEDVGRLVRIAIEENELYIFTHPELAAPARMRFDEIAKGYDRLSDRI